VSGDGSRRSSGSGSGNDERGADSERSAVQTAALIVKAAAQIYTMLLLRNDMRSAANGPIL
jgi:hypothetical protein